MNYVGELTYTEEEVYAHIDKCVRSSQASRSIFRATCDGKKLILPIHQSYDDNSSSNDKVHKEDFYKTVDCAGFALKEIRVFVEDGLIVVKAIHDEVQDEHGNVYKNLSKTFPVSETYDFNGAKITLSLDGALTVYIPCKNEPFVDTNYTTNNPSNNEPTEEN
ncbi:protein lethal(2)essential for life [Copidosoma floridanum]|uniref:protein lethal(2)essential for life n=1 Tax=Copidosoma floridanum TaxID=29053 RepID=UPI0006C95BF4|nr:protein lethal(2)essential for life [Copidosoma floridanum]